MDKPENKEKNQIMIRENQFVCLWQFDALANVNFPIGISEENFVFLKTLSMLNRRTKITIEVLDDAI